MTIIYRETKGSALSYSELDGNFQDTIIAVRVFRDGLNANDTLAEDVFGLCMDLHYQADHATTPNKSPPFV